MPREMSKTIENNCIDIEYEKDVDTLCRCWIKILDNARKSSDKVKKEFSDIENLKILNLKKEIYRIMKQNGRGLNSKDIEFLKSIESGIEELNYKLNEKKLFKLKSEYLKINSNINDCLNKLKYYKLWISNLRLLKREINNIVNLPNDIKYLLLKFLSEVKKVCDSSMSCYNLAFNRWNSNKQFLEIEINHYKNKIPFNDKYYSFKENTENLQKRLCKVYESHRILAKEANKNISEISSSPEKIIEKLNSWISERIENVYSKKINFLSKNKACSKLYNLKLFRINLDKSLIEFVLKLLSNEILKENDNLLNISNKFLHNYLKETKMYKKEIYRLKLYIKTKTNN